MQALGHPPFLKVVHDARQGGFDAHEAVLHHRQGIGHIEETVGLILVQDLLRLVVQRGPALTVRRGAGLFQHFVQIGVLVVDEVQAAGHGLRGMPDREDVRVLGDGPAQDDGIEAAGIHEFPDEGGPFHGADAHVDAHGPQLALDDGGGEDARLVALVGQDGERQRLAVLVQDAVTVTVREARLGQQFAGPVGIEAHRAQARMIGPGARLVGPEGRFPQPQQDALDDVAPVDGAGDGLPYLFILEERMFQIEAQEIVDRGQISVFVEGFRPFFPRCLAQVLLRAQLHHVQAPGAGLHEHGGRIRDDAEDHLADVRPAQKVGGGSFQHDAYARLPALETVGPGAHRLAGEGGGTDVLPFQDVPGQDGIHPGRHGPGKKMLVADLEAVAIQHAEFLDLEKVVRIGTARGRVDDHFVGELHIRGRQFGAVFPEDALAQTEAQQTALVFHAEGLRRPAFRLQILVEAQRRHIKQIRHFVGGGVRRQIRDEVGGLTDTAQQNAVAVRGGHAALLVIRGGGQRQTKQQEEQKKNSPGGAAPCRRALAHCPGSGEKYQLFFHKIFFHKLRASIAIEVMPVILLPNLLLRFFNGARAENRAAESMHEQI